MASCGDKQEEKKIQEQTVQAAYTTMVPRLREISGKVKLPGVLQPFEFVQLFPKVSGFIREVNVDRGSLVKKGQVLARLEAPEIEQQVMAVQLRYTQAMATYATSKDRYYRLLETSKTPGTISPFDLDAAATKMHADSALAQSEYASYQAQESQKAYLTIIAPFDGVITERNIHPGALAGPGTQSKPMLVLQQLSRLRLVVDVPEQYAAQVKDGDNVSYRVNAIPGKDFSGAVSRSSGSLSNSFRAETVEIDVQNTGNTLKPGMYAEVTLSTRGHANAFVLPRTAVVTTTEKKYVVALDSGMTRWVDVSPGNEGEDSVEVFGNIADGAPVVVNASYQIKNGIRLNK